MVNLTLIKLLFKKKLQQRFILIIIKKLNFQTSHNIEIKIIYKNKKIKRIGKYSSNNNSKSENPYK